MTQRIAIASFDKLWATNKQNHIYCAQIGISSEKLPILKSKVIVYESKIQNCSPNHFTKNKSSGVFTYFASHQIILTLKTMENEETTFNRENSEFLFHFHLSCKHPLNRESKLNLLHNKLMFHEF